ncbi:hypothetical protein HMPREF1013_00824 [Bacillus sp. 2_A_57_CT2]|nr:hypothetical protein HMPREF1013_00824 [Bacillus sp. 2_A_57_CT2]
MINIQEHGGIFGGVSQKRELFTLDFPVYPEQTSNYFLTITKDRFAVRGGADSKTYVYDRKTRNLINSFYPLNNSSFYQDGKALILGDWMIGACRTSSGNERFFKQSITSPTTFSEIPVAVAYSPAGFYYAKDGSYGYLCEYNRLKKFSNTGVLLWEATTNSGGGFHTILFERNGIVYVGKNTSGKITPVNITTGAVYADIYGTNSSTDAIFSAVSINDKLIATGSAGTTQLNTLSADGKTSTFVKSISTTTSVILNKKGILIGDSSIPSVVKTHLYDENLNIIKRSVSSVVLSGQIFKITDDTVCVGSFRVSGAGTDTATWAVANIN